MYIWSNKILNLNDYIFKNENYEDTKDTSKRILSIRKCIELYEIQNIILNILDDDNICELNRDISKIFSMDNKFCDVLAIFVDNLLNEDSKLYFKFFQVFS